MSSSPETPAGIDPITRLALICVVLAGVVSAAAIGWMAGAPLVATLFLATVLTLTALVWFTRAVRRQSTLAGTPLVDWSLTFAAIEHDGDAIAVTDRDGRLLCANHAYEAWFGGLPAPSAIAFEGDGASRLAAGGRAAWRDGSADVTALQTAEQQLSARVARAGQAEDHLVWRFHPHHVHDPARDLLTLVTGDPGRQMGAAGVMAALVDRDGRLLGANRVLSARALDAVDADATGRLLTDLLRRGPDDRIRFAADGDEIDPLRLVQVPIDHDRDTSLFLILDESPGAGLPAPSAAAAAVHIHNLLAMLPLGLALAERDGRLLFVNAAFERAAGLQPGHAVVYPSDLVVKEDKGAVSDAVRRFGSGRQHSGDLSIRLRHRPEEPVSLTIATARGLGDASVLLSLKDSTEESKLKRQVAQATKMQAVGQLAGGVAHDFNNILTAIIGHCDLMMMRHTPGDSDYDDIQQIKHNSNRAAGLTRQLLAFSRQQTLRPQVLQLPDVISEISNLLKRLLGETVTLQVKHGRGLGAVRADPGQLEQVIVNLAVNARDAMPGGGTLTLQTYGVTAAQVRDLRSDVLPVGDYTALSVTDTGTGIPPEVLGKVFEPFYTTKEVGKGTGLGLSTVYGIVKQSGGFIFADSQMGQGTSFVIYLPVHQADSKAEVALPPPKEMPSEVWGTGTILLVEDEDMVRAVAERALVRQGYRVLTASNGELALEMLGIGEWGAGNAEPVTIDLLVTDVVMPTMDGPTMVRHAREQLPQLPVLFMSGYAEEQLRRSIAIDNVAFLPKPFSVQQLGQAARDALGAALVRTK
ncbi:MAG TPA: ATP-binding protein [Sphingomonas sp.]|jgi:two-component system cell cycle sensor histidine kinase/response regulator CckA|uniref:ATP-binding protein n=1 Tax=Sphingomonas sp. TaxID=28214 RepID=UPI002ED989A7